MEAVKIFVALIFILLVLIWIEVREIKFNLLKRGKQNGNGKN
jgi:hypothetical protein